MKTIEILKFGGPETLALEELPKPKAEKNHVSIKVIAAGVNPFDWKVREGYFPDLSLPLIPGGEVSGIIEEVGEGVNQFKVGDKVFAILELGEGGYAEYCTADVSRVAPMPKTLNFIQAAAVPLTALTAWQVLFDVANLQPGQKILIHAAAGGVGTFAVQYAKWKGAYVIATASENNRQFLESLGIDEFIEYHNQNFEEILSDIDVVFDTVGGDAQKKSFKVLKKGGQLISIVQPPDQEEAQKCDVKAQMWIMKQSGDQLKQIGELIDQGKIKTFVDKIFPLKQANKAQEQSQTGHTRGKIVLEVQSP